MSKETYQLRFYTSYSGIKLPLKLVGEISEDSMGNRNTYFAGSFDQQNRLCIRTPDSCILKSKLYRFFKVIR